MSIASQLHVVDANQIAELKHQPALVLGRSLLAGLPICHLHGAARPIHWLLAGANRDATGPRSFLRDGGVVLSRSESGLSAVRFLDRSDVRAFYEVLKPWNPALLYRRFHQYLLATAGIESPRPIQAGWPDSAGWDDHGDEDDTDPDDWTLEQAEEFERVAESLQSLRWFVEGAVQAGRGIVLIAKPPSSSVS